MTIDSLTTDTFRLTGADYLRAWMALQLRRRALTGAALVVAVVAAGCYDLRYAISAAMLCAVLLPFGALLAWNKVMCDAERSHVLASMRLRVAEGVATLTILTDDGEPVASHKARISKAKRTGSWLALWLEGCNAPYFVPTAAITTLRLTPPPPETFD